MNRPVLHGACLEFRELPFANEFVACRFEERLTWAAFVGLVAMIAPKTGCRSSIGGTGRQAWIHAFVA